MSNNGLVLAILVVVVFVGLYWGVSALWLCKCQVKSDATGQTCILPADGFCSAYSWAMKGMSKDCKIEDCKDKFGSCENPSCSDKTKQENCGAGCTWNAGQAAIAAACTQNEGKEDGDCANKTTEDSCNQDPVNCSWTAARAAVPGSCSNDDTINCPAKEHGQCGAPCVYSPPKKENFASSHNVGPRRFILRNEDHLRSMLQDAGWDGQGGGWCPFANGIGCG